MIFKTVAVEAYHRASVGHERGNGAIPPDSAATTRGLCTVKAHRLRLCIAVQLVGSRARRARKSGHFSQ